MAIKTNLGGSGVSSSSPNFLLNSNFEISQLMGITIGESSTGGFNTANNTSLYTFDQWFHRNNMGTNSQLFGGRASVGQNYMEVHVATAPTASFNATGMELCQVLSNSASVMLYNQTASFSILVKALGNINQVGIQFIYATTEVKPTLTIGSEVFTTVNSSTFTLCTINGQALGTAMTTAGVIGVRIRATNSSSGQPYDVNNGFIVNQAMLNLGASVASYQRRNSDLGAEIAELQYFYEKSYEMTTAPDSASASNGCVIYNAANTNPIQTHNMFKVTKRATPAVTTYASQTSGSTGFASNRSGGAQQAITTTDQCDQGFNTNQATVVNNNTYSYHWVADARI